MKPDDIAFAVILACIILLVLGTAEGCAETRKFKIKKPAIHSTH